MEPTIIPMREVQRHYGALINKARVGRRPLFLGSHGKPQGVLMDIETWRRLSQRADTAQHLQWNVIASVLDRIAGEGKQDVTLSDFVRHDRTAH